MAPKRKEEDVSSDGKRQKRPGFTDAYVGVEASKCIKVFLVSCAEDVDAANCFSITPVDLSHFFGEDGKIYGYRDLKINIWLSCVSFHACADVTYHSTVNGSKGITNLQPILKDICGESLVENKEELLQTFSTESRYVRNIISSGEVISVEAFKGHEKASNLDSENASAIEIVQMNLSCIPAGELYNRLVILVHLFIDGGSPIDVSDTRWDIHFAVERKPDVAAESEFRLLGFATMYRFYYYPDSFRLRLGQILVLPPYQGHGHGRHLLQALNSKALSENVHDVTMEDPSEYLQHVRTCVDTIRLLKFEPIKSVLSSAISQLIQSQVTRKACSFFSNPPACAVDEVRRQLKINKKQFLRCWEVLVYLGVDQKDHCSIENYTSSIFERMKVDVLGKELGTVGKCVLEVPSAYGHGMAFVMFQSQNLHQDCTIGIEFDKDRKSQEEQLDVLVGKRMEEISKVAENVSLHWRR